MAKSKTNPPRSKVKRENTWDLSKLFKNDAAWERAYNELEKLVPEFEKFRGQLSKSARKLRECYGFEVAFDLQAERLGSYAFLKSAEDLADSAYQGMTARYIRLATIASEAACFMAPEIQAIPKKKMDSFLKSAYLKDFKYAIEKLLRHKPHILSQKEERLLAMQGEVAGTADKVFEQLTDADLKFGFVKNEKGESVELTQGSFSSFLESPKRSVRKAAFNKFYKVFEEHKNTVGATLSQSVLQDIYHARVRKHKSVRHAALFRDKVPLSVYDNLIDTVHQNLDTLYRYLDIRKRALGVRDLHFYDNYVPIVKMKRWNMKYEDAVGTVIDSLEPLGAQYCNTLKKGLLDGRWADRYENQGKRSGAFSAGGFQGPPYMLLNYKDDRIGSMFTLAHEAGHSMHTHYSSRNQPFQYYHYTIFVAEVASTFNELLLSDYLLERAKDKKTKAFLISRGIDEIRGTLVRQTMFAEFEKIIHELVEAGEPLTLERSRAEYRTLLDKYFGPKFVVDDVLSLEGLRIPHFYRAFYVYKYATGISAAIALSQSVLNGGKKERDRYLSFLKMGSSKYPLEELRAAGVDMEKPEPVNAAMARLKELVDQLDELV